jgi:hypothetical protein
MIHVQIINGRYMKIVDLGPAPSHLKDRPLPQHKFWGAGEADCPEDLKAPNGELVDMRCKMCGDGWRKSGDVCWAAFQNRGSK